MGNLFGIRRRAPVITEQDRAILQLKQQRDKIKIYQKKTELGLEKNKELALKLFQNGMKDRAVIVLRRKKYMEEVLSRTDNQLATLEQLVLNIEFTQIQVSVVEGLRVGTEALKQLNSLMSVDDIQQMMEDSEEAAAKQKEISEILSRTSERFDEDELLEELDALKEPQKPSTPAKKEEEEEPEAVDKEPVEAELVAGESTGESISQSEPLKELDSKIDQLPTVPDNISLAPVEEKKTRPKPTRQLESAQ